MHALRQAIKQKRKQLTNRQRQHLAKRAEQHLLKLAKILPKNAHIGLYLDAFGELPTAPLIRFCQNYGFIPYLPITLKDKPLIFAPIFYDLNKTATTRHRFGMKQPLAKHTKTARQLDCIICPLVAVDKNGNRLGMGGGFYDRSFATFNGLKVGWCYDFQIVEQLQTNAWDKAIDWLITDKKMIKF